MNWNKTDKATIKKIKDAFNCTVNELKLPNLKSIIRIVPSFNCTVNELKRQLAYAARCDEKTFNCTVNELKLWDNNWWC